MLKPFSDVNIWIARWFLNEAHQAKAPFGHRVVPVDYTSAITKECAKPKTDQTKQGLWRWGHGRGATTARCEVLKLWATGPFTTKELGDLGHHPCKFRPTLYRIARVTATCRALCIFVGSDLLGCELYLASISVSSDQP